MSPTTPKNTVPLSSATTTTQTPVTPAVAQNRRYLDDPKNPRRRASDAAAPEPPKAYPAARYHAVHGSRTVKDEQEDKALGEGWSETPPEPTAATYPGWRFHATKAPVLVNTKAEDDALGPGWYPTVKLAAESTA